MPRISRKAVLDVLPKYAKSRKRNPECVYVNDAGTKPVCLVGTILVNEFGVKPETLLPNNTILAASLTTSVDGKKRLPGLTPAAALVLDHVQVFADEENANGVHPTWGQAVSKYLDVSK